MKRKRKWRISPSDIFFDHGVFSTHKYVRRWVFDHIWWCDRRRLELFNLQLSAGDTVHKIWLDYLSWNSSDMRLTLKQFCCYSTRGKYPTLLNTFSRSSFFLGGCRFRNDFSSLPASTAHIMEMIFGLCYKKVNDTCADLRWRWEADPTKNLHRH
jgi:hypothetical protein